MRRILIVFAHPALHRSHVNRRLRDGVADLDSVTVHDLYAAYPDFVLDIEREQSLAASHDVLVLQHPMFWYSCPAILKEWQDLVLQFGWAYGAGGDALRGKLWLSAVTTGGGREAYAADGHNRYTVRELMRPFERTAALCGMQFLPPFLVHGSHALRSDAEVLPHARAYRALLSGLRDETIDLGNLCRRDYANRDDDVAREGESNAR